MPSPAFLFDYILLLAVGHYSFAHPSSDATEVRHWSTRDDFPGRTNAATRIGHRAAVRKKRESPAIDFTWKTTSKPKFVTGKTQKVEPILTVYPPDVVYRTGRGRDPNLSQNNGLKRVIYYATLPEINRYVPPPPIANDRRFTDFGIFGTVPGVPLAYTNQRSYDPTKVGKDFVTRVQSSVIDVRPRGDKKKEHQQHSPPPPPPLPPSFTVIDTNPTYPDAFDRIAILNNVDNKDKITFLQGYVHNVNDDVEQIIPYQQRRPEPVRGMEPALYYNMRPYQNAEFQKVVGPAPVNPGYNLYTTYTTSPLHNPPTYPTRHNRFPSDRYPPNSPLAAILGTSPPQRPNVEIGGNPQRRPQQGLGANKPSTSSSWIPTSSLELADNPDPPPFDHSSLDLGDPSLRPLSYKNKFSTNLDSFKAGSPFGNKYTDFGTFNTDFSINKPSQPSSFKPNFSQVSDWLSNKPALDLPNYELQDLNNALASNAATSGHESSSNSFSTSTTAIPTALGNGVDSFNEMNNTIITPYLASFPNPSMAEGSQDD